MSEPTFADLWLSGQVEADDIDDFVGTWAESMAGVAEESRVPLHDYLGMTEAQYDDWLRDPDSLDREAFTGESSLRGLVSDRGSLAHSGGQPNSVASLLVALRMDSLDARDQGDKFERLILTYLRTDPEWTARFSDVWLWADWPGRNGRPDTGIDIVARNRDREDFTAIQCKFYGTGHRVSKGDIDSFISASARSEFSNRIIFDTAAGWSGNAEETLVGVAQRIDIAYLDGAAFDWSQYSWSTPEVLVPTGRKALRPHQAIALADVKNGFAAGDRGKLIMACGTGKTYTSLKIAEDLVGEGGTVLFLVPSIQLLSQSLREWMAETEIDIRPFAVCSDVRVGRRVSDDAEMSIIDLTEPATTDAQTLVARMVAGRHARDRMTVVFSTYQSLEVIAQAQKAGMADFDLVICDEAHRTTGVTLAGGDESAFVRIHDNDYVHAAKRLYMTATPRVFGDEVRKKASDADAVLADMGDEGIFGPEMHRLGFGDAVEAGLLTDYKVLVLAIDEDYVAENFQNAIATSGEIALGDAAKLIGCWNGLAKNYGSATEESADPIPMRRAIAFAKNIRASKAAAVSFPALVDRALQEEVTGERPRTALHVEAEHVDGTMGIHERNKHIAWLKAETPGDVCRVLSNARCLSEGVDVPALDAVLFLTPRGSQVDVVQSVGRVMRKAPGKELGYIILPIVVPSGVTPEEALKDNERYRVVWQVLQALRSHDDRFHAMINQIELNKRKTDRLVIDDVTPRPETERSSELDDGSGDKSKKASEQMALDYGFDGFRDAMYARIVQKVGERRYWETWAKDVADIAAAHITRINGLLADEGSSQAGQFAVFLDGLRGNLNENITRDDAIEMLAQHLVTRPIFEALFTGYDFVLSNPVAKTMELMLRSLDEHNLAAENATLEKFYDSVRRRIDGVNNAEGKQAILHDLYDKFFRLAFRRTTEKLGVVYTPIEIVDFILRSADQVLRDEFGHGLTDDGVHVLDGFVGTGTFIVRLLRLGLIEPHDLARKYATELHANEILLLAYYVAMVNIETTYFDISGEALDFPGLVLTDTFQSWEPDDRPDLNVFPENNARLEHLKSLPITVIVGNPPYSAGQDSANDDNANEKYPALDEEIRRTYAERSTATLKNSLYDSYIRAIKWASLRIQDRGVIAYVTNGGFIDSNTADGMRLSLVDEFSAIHIFNLRGNQRTAGEQSRKEGGKVFGGGSRATVAITILVKDPTKPGPAVVYYADIGDYLSAEQKLAKVAEAGGVAGLEPVTLMPNEFGDWINQRRADFGQFGAIDQEPDAVFVSGGAGLKTNRDAWVFNFGASRLAAAMTRAANAYNDARSGLRTNDDREIKWSSGLESHLARRDVLAFDPEAIGSVTYRPFQKVRYYADERWTDRPGALSRMFPPGAPNLGIALPTPGSMAPPFLALMISDAADAGIAGIGAVRIFTRWRYEKAANDGTIDLGDGEIVAGYRRIDNISEAALNRYARALPSEQISKDDLFFYVYGVLHSEEYRQSYASDLKKVFPRIPVVKGFRAYADAGRALADLHLGYETVSPYPLGGLDVPGPDGDSAYDYFAVGAKKMSFGKPTAEQKAVGERHDRSVINYNDHITLSGIPEEAYRYMLGSRSAIEWIIDRYYVKTDKASGIVNDPNDWSREVGDPRYILDLLARIVTVSLETMKIVDSLPPLDILGEVG